MPEPILLTITDVSKESMPNRFWATRNGCCILPSAEQRLTLNTTNARTLAELFGDDSDGWAGKQIVLFASTTDFSGKQVGCLRIPQTQTESSHSRLLM